MKLDHPPLVELLQRAYSAEKAAAFAYVGHASSLKDPASKAAVNQIEIDEWNHRKHVLALMQKYEVPVSRYYEARFYLIGKAISHEVATLSAGSCRIILLESSRAATSVSTSS